MTNSLQLHALQHARLLCPPLSPRVCSNWCPLSWQCYLTISFSVAPSFFCLQFFPSSGSFPISHPLASGGQSIGASASVSVLPMNIQGWLHLGLTGLISLLSKGLSRVLKVKEHIILFFLSMDLKSPRRPFIPKMWWIKWKEKFQECSFYIIPFVICLALTINSSSVFLKYP